MMAGKRFSTPQLLPASTVANRPMQSDDGEKYVLTRRGESVIVLPLDEIVSISGIELEIEPVTDLKRSNAELVPQIDNRNALLILLKTSNSRSLSMLWGLQRGQLFKIYSMSLIVVAD